MRRTSFALTLFLASCGGDPVDSGGVAGMDQTLSDCDPVAPTVCGLPFPSTFYMREDASTGTGWRIHLGPTTLPINENGYQPDPMYWNERDGWSVLTPAMAHFTDISVANLPPHADIASSMADTSPTIIVDVETGQRIAHFAERDVSIEDGDRSLLMLHPVEPFEYGHRYVVGMRALVDSSGAPIAPTDAFAALRDGTTWDTWDVEGRRDVYDDVVFPALEQQGWSREETVLAWDFVTGSQEGITGKAVWMRDDSRERMGEDGPAYTVDEIEQAPNEHTAFRLKGSMTVPLYTVDDAANTVLTRGDDGMPYANGETTVPFTVIVPNSLVNEGRSGAIVQYGHGLLGDQSEVHAGYLSEMADRFGWVLIAVDWTGMKTHDVSAITIMLVNELDKFAIIPERSQQGLVEFQGAMMMAKGALVDDPNMQTVHPETGETVPLIDPSRRYYYGNSQGAIMGGAYIGLSPDIERAALGVGGTPYHMLLNRSADFEPFFMVFKTMYPDPAHVGLWLALIQTLWDPAEASGYTPAVTRAPLPGTNAKQVLLQVGIGDAQVSTLGAHIMARSYDAALIDPPVRDVYGLETQESGWQGSALVEWDYGLTEPVANVPPDKETDPHEKPRREESAQDQINTFFEEGTVVNYCSGECKNVDG